MFFLAFAECFLQFLQILSLYLSLLLLKSILLYTFLKASSYRIIRDTGTILSLFREKKKKDSF